MTAETLNGALTPTARILSIIEGCHLACCLYVATRLSIADHLANGPQTIDALAAANGSHAPALYRVLRALASEGIFEETEPGTFALTEAAGALQSGGTMKAYVQSLLGEHYHAYGQLLYSVQTGNTAFDHYFNAGVWQYYETHPQEGINFMKAMTGTSQAQIPHIIAAYDFSVFDMIIDIGGGNGSLLFAALGTAPHLKGIVFDRPYVVQQTSQAIAANKLEDRCGVHGGSFFEEIPGGADAYLMKYILHIWHDDAAAVILRNCARAMKKGSKLLVVDAVIPEGNAPHPGKFMDITMLAVTGGRERTAREFKELFEAAGLQFNQVIDLAIPDLSIVEGEKV
jgi:SAM-dependent methyltransferase